MTLRLLIEQVMLVFSKSSDLHTVLFGFWANLASHLGRSPFHQRFACYTAQSLLRLQSSHHIHVMAFAAPHPLLTLLHSMVQGIPSLVYPFAGEKVHWTFFYVRLTHSYGYGPAGDRLSCFASLIQNPESW